MNWLVLVLAAVAACELFLRLPLLATIRVATGTAAKAQKLLRSKRTSDHWKERMLPVYAGKIAGNSLKFFLYLCIILAVVVLFGLVAPGGITAWVGFLARPLVILLLCLLSIPYMLLRSRMVKAGDGKRAGDYSALDRLLHRLALGPLAEMLHDIERGLYLKSSPQARGGAHVFVTGLARAGSTILMREIHGTGRFGSLTYADMPFVLAPNLWAKLAPAKPGLSRSERAHGDGIMVDATSPEALDEVYWRTFCGSDYIGPNGLKPHRPGAEALSGYQDLIRLVLRRTGKERYLSKNNNQILRLPHLAQAMPEALFLVPIRAPLQHAQSLAHQHKRFLTADAFTKRYMTWLGHHEFGATHRPFLFGPEPEGDPMALDYWLRLWIAVYQHLGAIVAATPNALMVPHQDLCTDPRVWPALCRRIGTDPAPLAEAHDSAPRDIPPHDPDLAAQADRLYQSLRSTALQKLIG